MGYSLDQIIWVVVTVALVMVSAIVHEVAHGLAALACGDATAKEAGRLTLDPRAHLDGFGSVLLPILMALVGGVVFGFAKPVPYNPRRLRHPRRDELIVALAGPASNLLQALLGAALLGLAWHLGVPAAMDGTLSPDLLGWLVDLPAAYVSVNLVLCFFNLIPFPPLDGSKVVLFFLSGPARRRFYELERYAMPVLIIALYLVPRVLGVDPVGAYLDATAGELYGTLVRAVV